MQQRETGMQLQEIVNSCTHDQVAEAAVASIGEWFHRDIARMATKRDMSVGALVASFVRRYAWRAGESEQAELTRAMRGAQEPVLAGLRHIIEIMVVDDTRRAAHLRRNLASHHRRESAAA